MMGTRLNFGRGQGEDRFYNPMKARRNQSVQRARNNGGILTPAKGKTVLLENREPGNRVGFEECSKPLAVPACAPARSPCGNLDRFLESTTPSVPAQYLSKTRMRGWRTCDLEFQPYFNLGDLWESFKEWSAYGAGVPLVLNGCDSVVQYYVPYLSGIQIYGESARPAIKSRRLGEDSDGDYYRDSSSDGSSDCEIERGLKYSREQWSCHHLTSEAILRMDRLSLREKHAAFQEGSSCDDGEVRNSQGHLLFEFLEQDPPYSREPLADKISDLAHHFPELKTLRSCDLLPASWISVAWYPIYRIPTGPTLRDLDACFLTYHSLSTTLRGIGGAEGSILNCSQSAESTPIISLPVFGLASYKFKGSVWAPNGGSERQQANSLLQATDNWLRLLQVHHPDFQFFASHGMYRR